MRELYIDEVTCRDEAGNSHTFRYYLLRGETAHEDRIHTDYGVMVCACSTEQVRIPHITTDRHRIAELLFLLKTHKVSPSHLQDVIEDWL